MREGSDEEEVRASVGEERGGGKKTKREKRERREGEEERERKPLNERGRWERGGHI